MNVVRVPATIVTDHVLIPLRIRVRISFDSTESFAELFQGSLLGSLQGLKRVAIEAQVEVDGGMGQCTDADAIYASFSNVPKRTQSHAARSL